LEKKKRRGWLIPLVFLNCRRGRGVAENFCCKIENTERRLESFWKISLLWSWTGRTKREWLLFGDRKPKNEGVGACYFCWSEERDAYVFFFFLCKPKLREVEREIAAGFLSFWMLLLLLYQLREKQKGEKREEGCYFLAERKQNNKEEEEGNWREM
jgi:hypothetical protein